MRFWALTVLLALPPMEWRHTGRAEVREDGSILLPPDVAEEVLNHLEWAERAPALCEAEKAVERDLLLQQSSACSKALEKAEKPAAVGAGVIGGLVGVLLGIVVGFWAGVSF